MFIKKLEIQECENFLPHLHPEKNKPLPQTTTVVYSNGFSKVIGTKTAGFTMQFP